MAASGSFHPDVVIGTIEIRLCVGKCVIGGGLAILRVKIKSIVRKRFAVGAVIDVPVDGVGCLASLIFHDDARVSAKRHREKAIQGFISTHLNGRGLPEKIIAESQAEEIPDGSFNAGG